MCIIGMMSDNDLDKLKLVVNSIGREGLVTLINDYFSISEYLI